MACPLAVRGTGMSVIQTSINSRYQIKPGGLIGRVEYSKKGEKNHLPLHECDFNDNAYLRALKDFNVKGCVICEGQKVEKDAL